MLSVERELLERILDSIGFGEREELKAILDNQALESQYDGMTQAQAQAVSDGVDEILNGKPAAQHHGDPVAWQYRVSAGPATGWSLWHDGKGEEFKNSYQVEKRPLYAEQPAPVADHPQCEECKGWGYHENHHEGGGTECGECGGSGKAPVSVVMPEPYSLAMFQMISGFESVTPEQFDLVWSACRSEVARLNGVKP